MSRRASNSRRAFCLWLAAMPVALSSASAQLFEVKPIAEKKISQLPPGRLFWRIDTFPTLAQAQTAAGSTALEAAGKVWLFTLGPEGGSSPGGTKVAEIGPVPPVAAPEYLLRINITCWLASSVRRRRTARAMCRPVNPCRDMNPIYRWKFSAAAPAI
jgi:hypothetical protein